MNKSVRYGNGWGTADVSEERQVGAHVFGVAREDPEFNGTIVRRLGDSDDFETIGWDNSEKNWKDLESDPRALSPGKSAWGRTGLT